MEAKYYTAGFEDGRKSHDAFHNLEKARERILLWSLQHEPAQLTPWAEPRETDFRLFCMCS